VTANVLSSASNPRVRIYLPKPAHYLGAERWVLYDMADCELHGFVESDHHHHHVRKLYWIQFEGYLPSRPELKHTYDSAKGASPGGMGFCVDSWTRKASARCRQVPISSTSRG
jgi:hypothetical protein